MYDDRPDVRRRLEDAVVIWLTTVSPAGQPQSSPVWFLTEGDEFLVYSQPHAPRLRNIAANPRVSLNLDGDGRGGDIVTMEGVARVDGAAPPSDRIPEYAAKYRTLIESNGWTPASFAADYASAVRIRPTRLRSF